MSDADSGLSGLSFLERKCGVNINVCHGRMNRSRGGFWVLYASCYLEHLYQEPSHEHAGLRSNTLTADGPTLTRRARTSTTSNAPCMAYLTFSIVSSGHEPFKNRSESWKGMSIIYNCRVTGQSHRVVNTTTMTYCPALYCWPDDRPVRSIHNG
jgi:hypothetical protein